MRTAHAARLGLLAILAVLVVAGPAPVTSKHDSFFMQTYAITSTSGCVVSALTPSVTSPRAVGAQVTFTAQQMNCTHQ